MKRRDSEEGSRRLHEAAWPDMFANLQSAYGELTRAQFELEQRASEIEEARDLFERVVESMSEALFLMDCAGRIVRANPAAGALLERTGAELVGGPFSEVCGTDEVPVTPWQLLERAPGGRLMDLEVELHAGGGRPVPVNVSCGLVRDKRGKITGVLAVARDITERKRAEEERAQLLLREQEARREAETANRLKDEFLATVSHELRTPLSSILGWAKMLSAGHLDEQAAAKALEIIQRNVHAQVKLVNDLLDVSRIITGKLRLEIRPVELAPLVGAAVDAVRPAAEAKNIRLQMALEPEAGPVSGDADRLQQVVWNLLSNAVKFTPGGGRIEVQLEQVGSSARITVRDTGPGISPEFLPYVFDRFRQADGSITRAHGGLGLGLAIVRHLVELHGGTVRADSPGEGHGATFTVTLPLAGYTERSGSGATPAAVGDHPAGDRYPSLEGVRVLVVDDDPDACELLSALLGSCGAEVQTAASVSEAVEAFGRSRPNVLVSDIGMPNEDGYALIRRIRALTPDSGGRVPALALTAYASGEDHSRALSAGYQLYMPKPINPVGFASAVATLAGQSEDG